MNKPVRDNITLSTGAIIAHLPLSNDAQEAIVSNRESGEMTQTEWDEYCLIIRTKS